MVDAILLFFAEILQVIDSAFAWRRRTQINAALQIEPKTSAGARVADILPSLHSGIPRHDAKTRYRVAERIADTSGSTASIRMVSMDAIYDAQDDAWVFANNENAPRSRYGFWVPKNEMDAFHARASSRGM